MVHARFYVFVQDFRTEHIFVIMNCIRIKGEIATLLNYSRLSLSRPRLSRITVYLEVKTWSLFQHGNLITCNKILWKRGEIAPLFRSIFNNRISNFRSQITYSFVKCGCTIYFFPQFCKSDMSRYGYFR